MQKLLALIALVAGVAALWSAPLFASDRQNGRMLYETHCVGCHGDSGYSIDPTIPSFANGDLLFLMDSELLDRIRSGNQTMPAFRGLLSDQEIRDVISYLRTL